MTLPNVFNDLMMAQQPILTRKKENFGYELLFRDNTLNIADMSNGEAATSQVLINLCTGISELESHIKKPFFINMTTSLILSDAFFPIEPNTVYLEILEDQNLTPSFFKAVKKWHDAGYKFALDDYQFSEAYEALLPWVSIIKVDVLATPPEDYSKQIRSLKSKGLILLAEKVENADMFERCKEAGFELFQGYFLQRPEVIKGKKVDSTTQGAIELINTIQDPNSSIDHIAHLVTKNPKLSYQLLRIINSPACGISRTIKSIKEAVIFLGLVQLKKWAMLIAFTSSFGKPHPFLKALLTRSRCCQLLAEKNQSENAESALLVGLMSGIDVILNIEKSIALKQISLDNNLLEAITEHKGEFGQYLTKTLSCEEQNWSALESLSNKERADLNNSFLEAMIWTDEVMESIR
ncbi:HDOD domain-containing protein [Marinomonas sp. C2222]|uniref:HDOD domain-containing protein n=1 Tax=Marinomonas sargassi TaxID=2984494 RepID=A0ABT2YN26_9GAMM|nr:HDOD domain-containing protein [Marinomonas sargassi]MCV2401287.1 HDOD domain-containing protein [Marinomonas sargassi]